MPSKSKLHKRTGKLKSFPTSSNNGGSDVEQTLSPQEAQQFESELCWCIQQLQTALKRGKLSPKQIQDHTKALNTLMNNAAPLIKKRQVMRLSFGDYRAKMASEDKKMNTVNSRIKVTPATPSKKSVFIKKSSVSNNFKFNLTVPHKDVVENVARLQLDVAPVNNNDDFSFSQSGNNFKFNFVLETN